MSGVVALPGYNGGTGSLRSRLMSHRSGGTTMTTPKKNVAQDLIGRTFGRLTVMGFSHSEKYTRHWRCLCECGAEKILSTSRLISANTRSCGCMARELSAQRHYKHGYGKRNSAGRRPRTWEIWVAMRDRCNAPNHSSRANYGGRGIKVCPEWDDFSVFLRDMGECPPKLTIERLDVNGNYEKSNCIWASMSVQRRNQRRMFSTTCVHGHPWTPENSGFTKGHRYCKVCDHIHGRKQYLRKKEKEKEKRNATI